MSTRNSQNSLFLAEGNSNLDAVSLDGRSIGGAASRISLAGTGRYSADGGGRTATWNHAVLHVPEDRERPPGADFFGQPGASAPASQAYSISSLRSESAIDWKQELRSLEMNEDVASLEFQEKFDDKGAATRSLKVSFSRRPAVNQTAADNSAMTQMGPGGVSFAGVASSRLVPYQAGMVPYGNGYDMGSFGTPAPQTSFGRSPFPGLHPRYGDPLLDTLSQKLPKGEGRISKGHRPMNRLDSFSSRKCLLSFQERYGRISAHQ